MDNNFEYISQTNESYIIKTETGKLLRVYKTYPTKSTNSRRQFDMHKNWLWIACIGLPLGGLLTVIFAPLVIWKNVDLLDNVHLTQDSQIHVKHYVILSSMIFFIGLGLFALFIMHLLF